MDFTSSITLKFNDLFSSGSQQAHSSMIAMRGTLEGINGIGLTGVQSGLTGMQSALGGINPAGISGVNDSIQGMNGAGLTEVQTGLAGMQGALGGINPAGISGVSESIGAMVPPLEQVIPQVDDLAEMLGGVSFAHLDGMSESLEGIGKSLGGIGVPLGGGAPLGGEVPQARGFGDVFRSFKTDTIANGKQAIEGMNAAMEQINKNQAMNRLAADLSIMANMTAPLRNALSSMMNEPSKLAGTFESSMKNIQAITGLSSDKIDKLGNKLLSMGGKATAGPQAVAAAYNDVAGGITKTAAQMPVMENALALAEAGQADLGVATNGLVKIMNSYNFTAGETAEINARAAWASDVMTQAVGMGVGSMNEFVSAMAPISGIAASVGIGFDEIGSTMAYMTATTDTAATAGTKLQSFMAALQRPSDALAAALQSVGIHSGSAMLAEYGLAESAQIVSNAFNGDQDAIAQAMGRMEAMKAVVSLTGSTYSDFATEFGSTMDGITEKSQAIQTQSYESKVARLNAATDALQIQIGADINRIKGFFVDMGAGFLTHAVTPIVNSPIGPVFTNLAAGVGLAAKGVLDVGSGVLNTAAQFSVLTANIKNSEGFAKLFKSSLQLLGAPFKAMGSGIVTVGKSIGGTLPAIGSWIGATGKMAGGGIVSAGKVVAGFGRSIAGALPAMGSWMVTTAKMAGGGIVGIGKSIIGALPALGGWIASMWAAAAAHLAAFWPIYAIIGGVAVLATGVVLLIKHWSTVSGFFVGLWQKVSGAFSTAWSWIKNTLMGASNWILGAVALFFPFIGVPLLIIKNWARITEFFGNLWTGLTAGFTATWTGISGFFSSLWDGVKTIFMDFVSWVGSIIEPIIAPFRAIGDTVSGIFGKIGGFFKGLAGDSAVSGAQMNTAFAGGIQANAQAPTQAFSQSLTGIDMLLPHSDAQAGPLSRLSASGHALTETFASGMESDPLGDKAAQVFQAALPLSLITGTSNVAGSALVPQTQTSSALPVPSLAGEGFPTPDLELNFPGPARPERSDTAMGTPVSKENAGGEGPLVVHIQNFTINANDLEEAFDMLRQLRHITQSPQEAAV